MAELHFAHLEAQVRRASVAGRDPTKPSCSPRAPPAAKSSRARADARRQARVLAGPHAAVRAPNHTRIGACESPRHGRAGTRTRRLPACPRGSRASASRARTRPAAGRQATSPFILGGRAAIPANLSTARGVLRVPRWGAEDAVVVFARSCGSVFNKPPLHTAHRHTVNQHFQGVTLQPTLDAFNLVRLSRYR